MLKYEELRKTFVESQSEVETYKRQIKNKDEELESKTKLVVELENRQKGFRVLYARYGKGDKYQEVTNKVVDLLKNNNVFNVGNEEMGVDPAYNIVKELFIVYQSVENIKTLNANEYERVERKGDILLALETERSKQPQGARQY
jgi:hypothetical protein